MVSWCFPIKLRPEERCKMFFKIGAAERLATYTAKGTCIVRNPGEDHKWETLLGLLLMQRY
jgi:hypothetical protein